MDVILHLRIIFVRLTAASFSNRVKPTQKMKALLTEGYSAFFMHYFAMYCTNNMPDYILN